MPDGSLFAYLPHPADFWGFLQRFERSEPTQRQAKRPLRRSEPCAELPRVQRQMVRALRACTPFAKQSDSWAIQRTTPTILRFSDSDWNCPPSARTAEGRTELHEQLRLLEGGEAAARHRLVEAAQVQLEPLHAAP